MILLSAKVTSARELIEVFTRFGEIAQRIEVETIHIQAINGEWGQEAVISGREVLGASREIFSAWRKNAKEHYLLPVIRTVWPFAQWSADG